MQRRNSRRWAGPSRDQGAVAVEFAIVLPVLLLIVFGIIQFGILFAQQNAMNGAVRTGARFGSVNAYAGTHTCAQVIDRVQQSARTIGMGDGTGVEVKVTRGTTLVCSNGSGDLTKPPCEGSSIAAPATLEVSAEYKSDFIVPLPLGSNSMDLASQGVYQCEYS